MPTPAIKDLVKGGTLRLLLFDQCDMASITSPDFPDERFILNPAVDFFDARLDRQRFNVRLRFRPR